MADDIVPVPERLKFNSEQLRVHLSKNLSGFACKQGRLEVRKYK